MSVKKRLRDLERQLGQGWRVEVSGHHIAAQHESGRKLFAAKTPSDRRADLNFFSAARKVAAGVYLGR